MDFYIGEWIFGNITCKISAFFLEFLIINSIFILLWISIDQYLYVFYSTTYNKKLYNLKVNMISTIILAVILSIPYPIIYHSKQNGCNKTICVADNLGVLWREIVLGLQTVIYYIFPIILMIFFYSKILIFLNRKLKVTRRNLTPISKNSNLEGNQNKNVTDNVDKNGRKMPSTQSKKTNISNKTIVPMIILLGISHMLFLLYQVFYPIIFTLVNKKLRRKIFDKISCSTKS
ncbi:hypothetical protein HZS_4515 [Henneguya salminicola]|nr:hypothetical protein HZS_4515 [Henneguya salminicola]